MIISITGPAHSGKDTTADMECSHCKGTGVRKIRSMRAQNYGQVVYEEPCRACAGRGDMSALMRPGHPQWNEFCDMLGGPDGLNFREAVPGDVKTLSWKCSCDPARPVARRMLAAFEGVNVEASLEFFGAHGGHCDCEILFNIDI